MEPEDIRMISRFRTFERTIRPLFLLLVVVLYTYLGAYIFHLVEEPSELEHRKTADRQLHQARRNVSAQIRRLYDDLQSTDRLYELDGLLQQLQTQVDSIYTTHGRYTNNRTNWDLWGAATYSISLYTTLGYGTLEAETTRGRVWTIIYALVGIPLLLFVIYDLGRGLAYVWTWLYLTFGRTHHKSGFTHLAATDSNRILYMPLLPLVLTCILWVLLASAIFMSCEGGMSYGEALYLMIESQLTIGLHNLIPEDRRYMILLVILVFIGLVLISTLIHLIYRKIVAVYLAIVDGINQQYRCCQLEGGDYDITMDTSNQGIGHSITRILYQLPAGSRIYYRLMGTQMQARLRRKWATLGARKVAQTQTDEYLSRSYALQLSTIKDEDTRSHDDVNSLVAMCDWSI